MRIVVLAIPAIVAGAASFYLLMPQPAASPPSIVVASAAVTTPPAAATSTDVPKVPDHPPSLLSMNPKNIHPSEDQHGTLMKLARDYPALVARANKGDIDAALELYKGLSQCAGAPHSQAELDARLSMVDTPSAINFAREFYQDCAPFSATQFASARHWLDVAAKAGDVHAQMSYVNNGAPVPEIEGANFAKAFDEYETIAKQYLDTQLAAGNVDALLAASAAYQGQRLFNSDPEKSYAYLYAYMQATGGKESAFVNVLARMQGRMSPETIDQATKEGMAIYAQCCSHAH